MKHNSREGQNQFETNNKQEEFEFRNAKIDWKKRKILLQNSYCFPFLQDNKVCKSVEYVRYNKD